MKGTAAICFLLTLLLACPMAGGAAQDGPEIVTFKGKGRLGTVDFTHREHHELGVACLMCHHTGVEAGKCSGCHGVTDEAPRLQNAFHLLCTGCHKQKGGPATCGGCHLLLQEDEQ